MKKILIKEKQLAMGSNVKRNFSLSPLSLFLTLSSQSKLRFSLMKRQDLSMLSNHVGEQRSVIYPQSRYALAHSNLNVCLEVFMKLDARMEKESVGAFIGSKTSNNLFFLPSSRRITERKTNKTQFVFRHVN